MTLITLLSTPKPFTDPFIATIQRNALHSWQRLGSEVEVLLIGNEPGVKEAAGDIGLRHLPMVERNEWGTPLVRSLLEEAQKVSQSPLMAIVNADIVLFPDFVNAARQVSLAADRFLVVGRRWGLDIDQQIDFGPGWQDRLIADVETRGVLHPIFSIDYFIFSRDQYQEVPDFVIGRPQWDNWMIYHARQQGWPVVDATSSVLVIHQNHDYRHLPGGKPPHGLEEGRRNRQLAGGERTKYMIIDANYRLLDGKLRRQPLTLERLLRRVELWLMRQDVRGIEWRVIQIIRRMRLSVGEQMPEGWVAGGLIKEDRVPDQVRNG
jgi:hypothetical protein